MTIYVNHISHYITKQYVTNILVPCQKKKRGLTIERKKLGHCILVQVQKKKQKKTLDIQPIKNQR